MTSTIEKKEKLRFAPTKGTEWQDICSHLDKDYKIGELREIASSIGIPTTNKTKRQLCVELALDYDEYMKKTRKCHNESLLDIPYEDVPNEELITFEEDKKYYCFTLEEFAGLKQGFRYINPYTRKVIPYAIVNEYYTRTEALKRSSSKVKARFTVHRSSTGSSTVSSTPTGFSTSVLVPTVDKNRVRERLSTIMESYQYLPFDKLLNLTSGQIQLLRSYLIGLGYQVGRPDQLLDKIRQNSYAALDWLLQLAIEQNRGLAELGLTLDNFFEEINKDDDTNEDTQNA